MIVNTRGEQSFAERHIGIRREQLEAMEQALGVESLDQLIDQAIPEEIRYRGTLDWGRPAGESELLTQLEVIASENKAYRSFIGIGYTDCFTPPVIVRNILENPGWYTQYTPYQSEIAQGRLEALLNFQTMVCDLTGMELSNASLLDEGTAAAEAMAMFHAVQRKKPSNVFFIDERCHLQTIEVVRARAEARGWTVWSGKAEECDFSRGIFGLLVQYPATDGELIDFSQLVSKAHAQGALVAFACDPLALCLLRPPGELGADAVVGSTQRLGMPMGYGGPHAAFFATRSDYRRQLPGRVIGVSRDAHGQPALRMALQTREQHIKRERATSNICTAQVLPAVVASMYAVYHGPEGLKSIAQCIHEKALALGDVLNKKGFALQHRHFFDTLRIGGEGVDRASVFQRCREVEINLRLLPEGDWGITLDETADSEDLRKIVFALSGEWVDLHLSFRGKQVNCIPDDHQRQTSFLNHPVFHAHRSETQMVRYIHKLQGRDLSLTHSMIPLGSCTMKLNATVEMMPITWSAFADLHPFVPLEQAGGYTRICRELVEMLKAVTGFADVSLQPNAGSQGEYAGLRVIGAYHKERGEGQRITCLIPSSAHGTNPASAVMAGMQVVVVGCDEKGNIDLEDLREKAAACADTLAALMVTYPSTHGVFERDIKTVCDTVHAYGGQVYMDGANMNALVGLCRPADLGMDVCHLNLHKTFCIPHGGGGPGMGPIAVAEHLSPFLPGHPVISTGGPKGIGPVAAAHWSSALVLLISWAYLKLMGEAVVTATKIAILNANYVARALEGAFNVLYKGDEGWVAHECILDLRWCKKEAGITVEDVAKRLIDYGFHAPTVSFPVADTMMVEPTESEGLAELDRFCQAMISIRSEIDAVVEGRWDRLDNPLKNAPHTQAVCMGETWDKSYSREVGGMPAAWSLENKFWPAVGRLDNAQGDRNLICSCPPLEAYA
ncbi:MAG: aminomethyl-transferring glycine dehydrogenase [Candidatus Latescibacterota bacterium]|nr:aminomethyl-transferring glycine dehydrogenase [Candidatus Latescibacterota bacterium]